VGHKREQDGARPDAQLPGAYFNTPVSVLEAGPQGPVTSSGDLKTSQRFQALVPLRNSDRGVISYP